MPNITQINQNEFEWQIRGEFDLTSAAAVIAGSVRGTGMTVVKGATGRYDVTVKGTAALRLVRILNRRANFTATSPATATGVQITTVTQNAGTDDIVITIFTTANPTTGAATDTTAATTISFEVVLQTAQMSAVI